jgi:ABC-2 type transport system permease protein
MTGASGNIYDLGYQGYDGPRLGRAAVARGLLRRSLAEAYGIGRGGRAKIAPFVSLGLALLPAILAVGISALAAQVGGDDIGEVASPIRHETYQGLTSALVMLFCAAQAPELFGRDQRYGVLPLYFSRVLTRIDYALARTGGLFLAVLVIVLVPQVVLTVGAALGAADPIAGLQEDAEAIPKYLVVGTLSSALLAGIAAVIAAWTPRRAYATAMIIAVFIVPPIIVGLTSELAAGDLARILVLFSPGDVIDGLNAAIFDTIPDSPAVAAADLPDVAYIGAAVVGIVASAGLVLRRYLTVQT